MKYPKIINRSMSTPAKIDTLKPPLRRVYNKTNRPVTVRIMRYYGVGVHYHVSITEADNPIWQKDDDDEWCAVWCYGDTKGRGRSFDQKFNTIALAEQFVEKTLKKEFPGQPIKYDDLTDKTKWHYREGD